MRHCNAVCGIGVPPWQSSCRVFGNKLEASDAVNGNGVRPCPWVIKCRSKQLWASASTRCSMPARGAASASRFVRVLRLQALGTPAEDVIGGILELVRTGSGPEASRKWAQSCMLSGECIKACDYGVNPRFLLAMARVSIATSDNAPAERRRRGVDRYREVSREVTVLSRLQLDTEVLERLGQKVGGGIDARRDTGLCVLHRVQRLEDAAHCPARAGYHGRAWRELPGDGRTEPLLRYPAIEVRRRRDVGAHGHQHHGKAVTLQYGPGDLLVPELLRPVHGEPSCRRWSGNAAPGRSRSIRSCDFWPAGLRS